MQPEKIEAAGYFIAAAILLAFFIAGELIK